MSNFGDIASWIKTQLETEVTALTEAVVVSDFAEFEVVGRNAPAAGILVVGGDATSEIILDGTQNIIIDVGIWVSSRVFRGSTDLGASDGLYDLFDDIYAALKNQTPTSGFSPLRYVSHDLEEVDGGLAIMRIRYQTSIVI